MSYNIKLTNGTSLVNIADGSQDSLYTSLILFGKNFAGYGPLLNQNLVKLLENFANATPPATPLQGQLWWDSVNKAMKVYRGVAWVTISGPTPAPASPTTDTQGELWWDSVNKQLNAFNGTNWSVIGPAYKQSQGIGGPVALTIHDLSGTAHEIVALYVGGAIVAVLSKDSDFTSNDISGFAIIKAGLTLSSTFSAQYYGNANNALSLGGVTSGNFLRSDIPSTTNFSLAVASDSGLKVGANNNLSVTISGNAVNVDSTVLDQDIVVHTNSSGVTKTALRVEGITGKVFVPETPTSNDGIANKRYVDNTLSTVLTDYLRADGGVTIKGSLLPSNASYYNLGSNAARMASVYADSFVGSTVSITNGGFDAATVTGAPTLTTSVTNRLYVNDQDAATLSSANNYTDVSFAALQGNPPSTLLTLQALAAAINNSPTFATTITAAVDLKASIQSPTFTGVPLAPTPAATDNSTQIATTAYVTGKLSTLSTGVTTSLGDKAPIYSPVFTGTPSADTPNVSDNGTRLATTAYVTSAISTYGTTVSTAMSNKAPKNSPIFTGTPVAPTPAAIDNSTQIATSEYVTTAIFNYATSVNTALGTKAAKDSPTFTGTPIAPTPASIDNSTRIATTEFVNNKVTAISLTAGPQGNPGPPGDVGPRGPAGPVGPQGDPATVAQSMTNGVWTVTVIGSELHFQVSGVSKAKLDQAGNFTVAGNLSALFNATSV